MKLALLAAAVDPTLGGVLVFGDRGTGKSTAVRALAALLPPIEVVRGCPFRCDPSADASACSSECELKGSGQAERDVLPVAVVDLPLGATEDRVVGALDLERALTRGEKAFEAGLLARAHRGFLYIDEVNLLEDHIVDLLLDVAASGENVVEREGLSVRHPARFVLVGSGNPEEGELRPQLLDRFGFSVDVRTPTDIDVRIEIVKRRDAFERDPERFCESWRERDEAIRSVIEKGRERLASLVVSDALLRTASELCLSLGTDGLRGELTLARAARAVAALEGARKVDRSHMRRVAPAALRHRLRRNPLDEAGADVRVERAIASMLAT